MKLACMPIDESDRLESLENLNILDSLPESDYDSIVAIAALVCKTPFALICLVDKRRIWFKARHGITGTEIPREAAFCSFAILQKDTFIVNDLSADDRFFDNPLVTNGAQFKFYAGVPLLSPDNHTIGTLCVLDTKPGEMNEDQIKTLKALSNQVTRLLELKSQLVQMQKHDKDRKQYEFQISEASRLSTLGEMAAGIAHEINNPLTIIQCKSKILKRKCEDGSLDKEVNLKDFEVINDTVDRIVTIVKGLKTYSRNSEHDPLRPANLKSLIDETFALCIDRFKFNGVNVSITCPRSIELNCRPSQISQVLMNLISNSYDAIIDLEEKWISINALEEDEHFKIIVADSGHGIPESIAEKMTQAFFTTKEVGKGTGLGLSISMGILETHGGSLAYDSQKPNTTFVLTFPKELIQIKSA